MAERKTYTGIDVAKFLMAILVLMLHTNPFLDVNKMIEWVSRSCLTVIAVPFFFIANGYFSLESDKSAIKSIKKLACLYVVWSIIYLPFSILKLKGETNIFLAYIFSFFVYGSYDTIWYLLASAGGVLFVWLLKRWRGIRFAVFITGGFHVIAILFTSYAGLFGNSFMGDICEKYYSIFHTFKNWLFFGGFYIALGGCIREEIEDKFKGLINNRKLIVLVCVLFVLIVFETAGCKILEIDTHGVDMKVMLVPFSVCFFVLILNWNAPISKEKSLLLRKMSILVFLTQRIFITGLELWGGGIQVHSLLRFFVVTGATLLLSYCIYSLSKKYHLLNTIY